MNNPLKRENLLKELKTNEQGLTEREAQKRLKIYGRNEIIQKRTFSALKIFLSQFSNFLIIILIIAAFIAFLAGKTTTSLVIFCIVALNIFLGFFMERRAEKSIAALKKMLTQTIRVIRNNKERSLERALLVPGDIIILEEGMRVPADAIVLEAISLEINQASLTGESMPVIKTSEIEEKKKNSNLIFMGTIIVKGYGKAVVIKTGMKTEFGKIANMLAEVKEIPSPLQKQTVILGKRIAVVAFSIAVLILLIGIIQGKDIFDYEQLMIALSLFVSIIPEGLAVVMTLALALGVHWMARQKAIMRKMTAVETLGCTQIICTDKTGTLTKNEMTVRKIWTGGKEFEVGERFDSRQAPEIPIFLKIGVLCNTAEVIFNSEGNYEILGEPTEASLLILGEKAGVKEKQTKARGKFIIEFPFEQILRRRAVVWEENNKIELFSVGSPETILEISSKFLQKNQEINLSSDLRKEIIQTYQSLAAQGYRMIALAYRNLPKMEKYERNQIEKNLVFVGLAAIYDAPRQEAIQAIKTCQRAGIRVVMITGDNELTALAIAQEVGLENSRGRKKVVIGKQLDEMKEQEFLKIIDKINVFARTTPAHKLRIVKAFQKKGKIVAVTGDGVNDAPALKEADIGIAMGITGTDVAKEASDMIITDDNFASIVTATKEGRTIFDNIKKFIQFLLTANAIETPLIIAAMFLGWPIPITPLQILWINLVTDSTPAVTLSIEPSTQDIMRRNPRPANETIFKGIVPFILTAASFGFLTALGIFSWFWLINEQAGPAESLNYARTMVFTFIVIFKLFLVFSCRSFKETILGLGFLTNKKLILAVCFSFFLQLLMVYHPIFNNFFQTTPLNFFDWLIIFSLAGFGLIFMEIKKVLFSSKKLRSPAT